MNLRDHVIDARKWLETAVADSWGFDKMFESIKYELVKTISSSPYKSDWTVAINSYSVFYFLDSIDSNFEELQDYFKQHDIIVQRVDITPYYTDIHFTFKFEG